MIDRTVLPIWRRKHARPQELLDVALGLFIERVRRGPAGSALPGIAPSNAYLCKEGYALIAGNDDGIFKRLLAVKDRADPGRWPLHRHPPKASAKG